MFYQLAHGLSHLHSSSIVHGIINLQNIVLTSKTPPFRVKYCDFITFQPLRTTFSRMVMEPFKFMAPEIVFNYLSSSPNKVTCTPAVDVWSLGIVLYLLVEKRYPFNGSFVSENDVIPRSNSDFGELIERMLVKNASQRITVEQLVNHPQIKELYDFIGSFDENLFFKYQLWTMKKQIQYQSNLIGTLQSTVSAQAVEICDLKEASVGQEVKISTQTLLLEEQYLLIQNLQYLVCSLHHENSGNCPETDISSENIIQESASEHSDSSSVSSDQLNLMDQFHELFPLLPYIKTLAIERQQKEYECNTTVTFICNHPSEVYSRFGNRTMFIGETKGSCLELSNDDCLVRSTRSCEGNSFVAINHPPKRRITLTLMSPHNDGSFSSCIGCFNPNPNPNPNPNKCQEFDCEQYFF
ncbi:hypothetical protein RCL1_000792 [Eukaryota sp. TZLM3-RCL]